jgi:hypothetical protein
MARYVVIVTAGDRTASLLVILSPSQLCSALVDAVKARLAPIASKLNLSISDNSTITLHLGNSDGPILDPEDLLSDVLPDANEVCYAVIEVSRNNPNSATDDSMSTNFSSRSKDLHDTPITNLFDDLNTCITGLADIFSTPAGWTLLVSLATTCC